MIVTAALLSGADVRNRMKRNQRISLSERIIRYIREQGGSTIQSNITNHVRANREKMIDTMATLVDEGVLTATEDRGTRGRAPVIWTLANGEG